MSESVPITRNDERTAAFYAITDAVVDDGSAVAAQIDKMLEGVATAKSWESMATRSASQSTPRHRGLVPVPIRTPRPVR